MWGYSWDGSSCRICGDTAGMGLAPGYVATVEDRRVSVVVGCSVAPRSSQAFCSISYCEKTDT